MAPDQCGGLGAGAELPRAVRQREGIDLVVTSEADLASRPNALRRGLSGPRLAQHLLDISVLCAALVFSYLLRFEFVLGVSESIRLLSQLPIVLVIQATCLWAFGARAFVWRYVGLLEAGAFLRAAVVSGAILVALRLGLPDSLHVYRVPLSIIVMDAVLGFGGVLGLRVLRRVFHERERRRGRVAGVGSGAACPVLLIGAGRAGVMAVRELQGRGDVSLDVLGFVDDDPVKVGAVIAGVKVLGTVADLPRLVRELEVDEVIITIAEAPRVAIRRIVRICERIPIKVRTIPGLFQILQGSVSIARLQEVPTEQLLDRASLHADTDRITSLVGGKVVMVTGAGGSIGSELARQVAAHGPTSLLLVERAEPALFLIDRELRESQPGLDLVPLIADVGDEGRMGAILGRHRPAVVLHAAAHKHVPMMERNAVEAVKNNVLGTAALGEVCGQHGVSTFVLISTDKAVKPTSVMGASKRVAELVVQELGRRHSTRYVAVRFGNVLGSTGSVVPIFQEQIARGGPVTVTHPEMVRFFMTIPEAASLVLEAASMGEGGEIFVLDMGSPVKVVDLARRLIELAGHQPGVDIEIVYTGGAAGGEAGGGARLRGRGDRQDPAPEDLHRAAAAAAGAAGAGRGGAAAVPRRGQRARRLGAGGAEGAGAGGAVLGRGAGRRRFRA